MKYFNEIMSDTYRVSLTEVNDCSVIALAISCNISYDTSYRWCRAVGRVANKGLANDPLLSIIRDNDAYTLTRFKDLFNPNGTRIAKLIVGQRMREGRFLCFVDGHAFSVVDGEVQDSSQRDGLSVMEAYQVISLSDAAE